MFGRLPSARCFPTAVALVTTIWAKDAAGGRVAAGAATVGSVRCQWDPGPGAAAVDETGRWTVEQPHVFRFPRDPGLATHDRILVRADGKTHDCVVVGASNPLGRGAFWVVQAVERS